MTQKLRLSPQDLEQLAERGITVERVHEMVAWLSQGFPPMELDRPATPGDGIRQITPQQETPLLTRFETARQAGRVTKFVPASGAASRMFASLLAALQDDLPLDAVHPDAAIFLAQVESLPFAMELDEQLWREGSTLAEAKAENPRQLMRALLLEPGLALASLPKGLIPFHESAQGPRTAFAEQLVEAAQLTADANGTGRIHFTVPNEFRERIVNHLASIADLTHPTRVKTQLSEQLPQTDTVALDKDGDLLRDERGRLVFRPGGHGALLSNLDQCGGDIVMIKNIDNVVPDHRRGDTLHWKKLLVGLVVELQERVAAHLDQLTDAVNDEALDAAESFLAQELSCPLLPLPNPAARRERARRLLHRPLRVCGMVRNQGEPGGGPFWVREGDGTISLQVVEFAQIDLSRPDQANAVAGATHFSPVDFVCGLRDHRGRSFPLQDFVDPATGFVSNKTKDGISLRALELPGLWNGSMARWNTVLVEVPITTFSPVKTVLDLLRPEHRPDE